MSCFGKNYIPIPARAWFRVQNQCSLDETQTINQTYETEMLRKGNVLQYKKNSSNLTQNQRYAKIARGQWTNRTTTWASQSQTVSIPNTKMLKRVGSTNVEIDPDSEVITETNKPLTVCSPSSSSSLVIQEGGQLICNVQENICTGKTITKPEHSNLFPTTYSNVPGSVKYLYWKDNTQTWYPKTRRVMNTSTTKWPVGAKFIQTAQQ